MRESSIMSEPKHPGFITYVDGDTNTTVSTDPVASVPPGMRFADTASGKVPVVKVVATTAGNQRFIREYGPGDQLLRSTVQLKG